MEQEIITFKNSFLMFFLILFEIAGNQLLCINLTQYSFLLTCFCGCVAEETGKPAESLPVFVSDYEMKQYVKTFFQGPAVLIFRAHSRFCGQSRWCN